MLNVTNTLSKALEPFVPIHPPFVGMYVCGPTVWDDPHLGHAKSYVSFDVVVRLLRSEGYKVRYVQNITDVGHILGDDESGEDRVLKKARIEKLEPVEIAQKYENQYFLGMDQLNCLRPDISCRATGHIIEMIGLVERLLEKGVAYVADGNVYFDLSRFDGYGKLSGRKVGELIEGVRIKTAEGKKHPADFALWKKADPNHLMQWPSPWGKGFPGWHLECSAMSMKYIGESLDIHGGGIDNQFPHHECEIAQSESATGKPFVKYWLHNNMVTVGGQKMSKSLGNFVTLDALFKKFHPMTLRFFILQGHYRSPQEFSDDALDAAAKGYEKLAKAVSDVKAASREMPEAEAAAADPKWEEFRRRFLQFMDNDFNTAGALSVLFDLVRETNSALAASTDRSFVPAVRSLFEDLGEKILGLSFSGPVETNAVSLESGLVDVLIDLRKEFRSKKEWARADALRDRLAALGIVIEDGKDGTRWSKSHGK
jgi:cysteinyl-tRNA synthetase